MKRLILLFLLSISLVGIFSACTKEPGEFLFDNPLDVDGDNYVKPPLLIGNVSLPQQVIPINDTLWVEVELDLLTFPEGSTPDSAYVAVANKVSSGLFESGVALVPVVQTEADMYLLRAWISDAAGRLSDTVETSYTVILAPPVIDSITPKSIWIFDTLFFHVPGYDDNGEIIGYFISDDGQNYTEISSADTALVFTGDGAMVRWVQVMDDDSVKSEAREFTIEVKKGAPTISSISPKSTSINDELEIPIVAADPNGFVKKYYYSTDNGTTWGQDTLSPITVVFTEKTNAAPLWIFAEDDDELSSDTIKTTVAVSAFEPVITEAFKDATYPLYQDISIAASAEDSDGDVIAYKWQVNGGVEILTEVDVLDTAFSSEGDYQVTLTVMDDDSLWSTSKTITITILDGAMQIVETSGDITIESGSSSTLWAKATSSLSTITGFKWSLDGGKTYAQTISAVNDSASILFNLTEPGDYSVWVVAVDNNLAETAPSVINVTVEATPPTVFIDDPLMDTVFLIRRDSLHIETSTSGGTSAIAQYLWYLNGTLVDTGEAKTGYGKKFQDAGRYVVSVEIEDQFGQKSDRDSIVIKVMEGNPIIDSISEPISTQVGTEISVDVIAKDTLGQVDYIQWTIIDTDSGDTLLSKQQLYKPILTWQPVTLTHTFTENGVYKIEAIAFDNDQNQSEPKYVTVNVGSAITKWDAFNWDESNWQ